VTAERKGQSSAALSRNARLMTTTRLLLSQGHPQALARLELLY